MVGLIVVAYLRYALAAYFMADNWELSPLECIRLSKEKMEGNKASYLLLMLSFIGWAFLASIPESYILQFTPAGLNPVISIIVNFISRIPIFFVLMYMTVAQAFFYEIAAGNIRKGY